MPSRRRSASTASTAPTVSRPPPVVRLHPGPDSGSHHPRATADGGAAVERTALIPLAARAQGLWPLMAAMTMPSALPFASFAPAAAALPWWPAAKADAESQRVLSHVRDDAHTLPALWGDPLVMLNVLWRTQLLREAARQFFARHPDGTGVNLGCGMSDPFPSLNTGHNRWIDADLPHALRQRHRVMHAHGARHTECAVDLRQHGWWQALGLPDASDPASDASATPVFVLCEGVMMYLTPQQAHAALHEFAQHAPPGSQWAMDVISSLGVGCAALMPSLATTGAQFQWGVRDLDEFKAIHPRLELLEAHSVAECWGPAGLAMQALCWPWLGAPPYSVVTLSV